MYNINVKGCVPNFLKINLVDVGQNSVKIRSKYSTQIDRETEEKSLIKLGKTELFGLSQSNVCILVSDEVHISFRFQLLVNNRCYKEGS